MWGVYPENGVLQTGKTYDRGTPPANGATSDAYTAVGALRHVTKGGALRDERAFSSERRSPCPAHVRLLPTVYTLYPIGVVRSSLTDPRHAPKQGEEGAPDAWLELVAEVAPGLQDLKTGDRVMILTWLDQADRAILRVHPRDDAAAALRGVFSTRSADRPNPIGLHRVTVREVGTTRLRVGPLEAIDGTPVLDIKPMIDEHES